MIKFLGQRIVSGLLSLLFVIVMISGIIYLAPVDPATLSFGQQMSESALEAKRKELGLDLPIKNQVFNYLIDLSPTAVLHHGHPSLSPGSHFSLIEGNNKSWVLKKPYMRESFQTGNKVGSMIIEVLPNTIILAVSAIIIATIIGLLLGMLAVLNKDTWLDSFIVSFSTLGYSVPSYVSAIVLSLVFGFYLKDWTNLNMQGSLMTLNDIGDEVLEWKNLILPAIALGVRPVAVITQITRNAMSDVMSKPYIKTARAKGLSTFQMIKNHIFKNMMNPIVTTISGWFAAMLAGAFFVESIFNYGGMGLLTVNALINYDTPLLLGCIIVIATIFIVLNIIIDLMYTWIDPRVKIREVG